MSTINNYEVLVGNIGLVHAGPGYAVALGVFNDYKKLSNAGFGRAAGEAVTLLKNGEPLKEFTPKDSDRFQTLTLKIQVTYDLQGGATVAEVENQLCHAADFLSAEGLLSGETEAVVHSWKATTKVKAKVNA